MHIKMHTEMHSIYGINNIGFVQQKRRFTANFLFRIYEIDDRKYSKSFPIFNAKFIKMCSKNLINFNCFCGRVCVCARESARVRSFVLIQNDYKHSNKLMECNKFTIEKVHGDFV